MPVDEGSGLPEIQGSSADPISIEQLANYLGTDVKTLVALERVGVLSFEYNCAERQIGRDALDRFLTDYQRQIRQVRHGERRAGIERRNGQRTSSIERRQADRRRLDIPDAPRRRVTDQLEMA